MTSKKSKGKSKCNGNCKGGEADPCGMTSKKSKGNGKYKGKCRGE